MGRNGFEYPEQGKYRRWRETLNAHSPDGTVLPWHRDSADPERVDTSMFGGAPRAYWFVANHITGWKSEVASWLLLFVVGILLGYFIGRL